MSKYQIADRNSLLVIFDMCVYMCISVIGAWLTLHLELSTIIFVDRQTETLLYSCGAYI